MKVLGWLYPVIIWGTLVYFAVTTQFGATASAVQVLDSSYTDSAPDQVTVRPLE